MGFVAFCLGFCCFWGGVLGFFWVLLRFVEVLLHFLGLLLGFIEVLLCFVGVLLAFCCALLHFVGVFGKRPGGFPSLLSRVRRTLRVTGTANFPPGGIRWGMNLPAATRVDVEAPLGGQPPSGGRWWGTRGRVRLRDETGEGVGVQTGPDPQPDPPLRRTMPRRNRPCHPSPCGVTHPSMMSSVPPVMSPVPPHDVTRPTPRCHRPSRCDVMCHPPHPLGPGPTQ